MAQHRSMVASRPGRKAPQPRRRSLRPLLSALGFVPYFIVKVLEALDIGAAAATGSSPHDQTFELLHPFCILAILLGFAFSRPLRRHASSFFTAAQDLLLAGVFLGVWLVPSLVDEAQLHALIYLVMLEGFAVWFAVSLALVWDGERDSIVYAGLVVGSAVHALVAWHLGHWWPAVSLTVLAVAPFVAARGRDWQDASLTWRWGVRLWLYAMLYFGVTSLSMPRLGFATSTMELPHWISAVEFGVHEIMALGFFYFLALALLEITEPPKYFEHLIEGRGTTR